MGIEYLGHKRNILDFIMNNVSVGHRVHIADLFSGSGSVSAAFKRAGCKVSANDNLEWCAVLARAILFNSGPPRFKGLESELELGSLNPKARYLKVLEAMNATKGSIGFVTRTYSPLSAEFCEHSRQYFTIKNARKIDGIRSQIRKWTPLLSTGELNLLISDLILAANAVSNIAGTYGCYLKSWKSRALHSLGLIPSEFVPGREHSHAVTCLDAAEIAGSLDCSVVYADPPYTKRQYAAYYHVLETIALGDSPEVSGSTGLRSWREKASAYCLKRTAPGALAGLVASLSCEDFFLSYSEDGQIRHDTVMEILGDWGTVEYFELEHKRYKSSTLPHKGASVKERLYHLKVSN